MFSKRTREEERAVVVLASLQVLGGSCLRKTYTGELFPNTVRIERTRVCPFQVIFCGGQFFKKTTSESLTEQANKGNCSVTRSFANVSIRRRSAGIRSRD
jgi:hypothetical protein